MFEGMSEWYEALVQCPSMYIQKKHHVLWRKGPRNIRTAFLRTQIEVRDTLILAESILVQPVVAFICPQGCGIRGGNEAEAWKRHFPGIETGPRGLKPRGPNETGMFSGLG